MVYDPSRIGTSDFSGGSQSRSIVNADQRIDRPSVSGGGADWASEDEFWRNSYASRPYASADLSYEFYQPAYRYGYESSARHEGRHWDEVEPELRQGWDEQRGSSKSTWEQVKGAVRDAWDRMRM